MKNILLVTCLLYLPFSLFAYEDYDMDGVEDSKDRCPNSLITDLVDNNGCIKKSLVSPHHYDVILGFSYSQVDYNTQEKTDNLSGSIQLDYYYKKFSLQLSTSYFNSESLTYSSSGINDTFVSGYYAFKPLRALSVRAGLGLILPTYASGLDNNNIDEVASLSVSYSLDSINLFAGYGFTLVNDDDIDTSTLYIKYQNVNSFYGGLGFYPTSKLYLSGSYNSSDSIYDGVETIKSASVYVYYSINKNLFTTLNYGYGLSDSASNHSASLRIGYYF